MRKKLGKLAALVEGAKVIGDANLFVTDIVQDSRQATKGALFVCVEGEHVDGHKFIPDVKAKGAAAIITEREMKPQEGLAVLQVPKLDEALQIIVPYFFDIPSQRLRMIGITGTNGKTTTSFLLRSILRRAGHKVGLIGT
ncbi:MAG: UDP-N-acetylmuramoyl-L-alanyl-D-glutamate--2,6-diaminopimelate ligase, partial [Schwartzia sp.]|nr:UDP-N-acetylmuramoyl-L-alanyl-D-glutamate--2,6-diaminopimelate ligase [Schwartzia sp. (in: firmicutes)]